MDNEKLEEIKNGINIVSDQVFMIQRSYIRMVEQVERLTKLLEEQCKIIEKQFNELQEIAESTISEKDRLQDFFDEEICEEERKVTIYQTFRKVAFHVISALAGIVVYIVVCKVF